MNIIGKNKILSILVKNESQKNIITRVKLKTFLSENNILLKLIINNPSCKKAIELLAS